MILQDTVKHIDVEIHEQKEKFDQALDEALMATFPASDPVAFYYPKSTAV